MKQIMMLLAAMLLTAYPKDSEVMAATVQEAGKTLVAYYSYTGNCQQIVESLTAQIQADVMRIEPADKTQKYEANGYAIGTALLNAIKVAPNDAASYPAIDPVSITDLSQYQNIIIVTPLWWSQMAAIMQTYLFNYGAQMAGKHVALIVSSHSSGISGVVADAKRLVPDCTWMGDALWINASNHSNRASRIQSWLPTLNFAEKQTTMDKLYITISGLTQPATLVDNAATQALMERLRNGAVTVTLNSSGGFEIWGPLGFSLPTSNEQINAQPGDIILYSGSNICMFYGSNSWSYTRLGKIDGLSESEIRTFLKAGESNISVTFSPFVPGDVNKDGKVTPADAIMILYAYFGVEQQEFNREAADLNGDGFITPADAIEALYRYFGAGNGNSNARSLRPITNGGQEPE